MPSTLNSDALVHSLRVWPYPYHLVPQHVPLLRNKFSHPTPVSHSRPALQAGSCPSAFYSLWIGLLRAGITIRDLYCKAIGVWLFSHWISILPWLLGIATLLYAQCSLLTQSSARPCGALLPSPYWECCPSHGWYLAGLPWRCVH